MQMTEAEIVRSYQHAANRTKQISILAELNACSKAEIRDILEKNGEEVPHYGNRYTGKVKEVTEASGSKRKRSSVRMSERRKKKSDSSDLSTRLLKSEEPTAKDWAETGEAAMRGVRDGLKEATESKADALNEEYRKRVKLASDGLKEAEAKEVPAEVIAITIMKINDLKKEMGAIQEQMDKLQTELQERLKMCNRLSVWLDEVKKEGET